LKTDFNIVLITTVLFKLSGVFELRGRSMRKKIVHIISHSHWDREWYMPFEKHRLKLVNLVDDCLELFENRTDLRVFIWTARVSYWMIIWK